MKLRAYETGDAAVIVSWIGDEFAFRQWSADRYDRYPITADDMNRHYAALADAERFFPMTAVDEDGVVGHLILRFTDAARTIIRLGFVIVDPAKRGRGYGREMLRLALLDYHDLYPQDKRASGRYRSVRRSSIMYSARIGNVWK